MKSRISDRFAFLLPFLLSTSFPAEAPPCTIPRFVVLIRRDNSTKYFVGKETENINVKEGQDLHGWQQITGRYLWLVGPDSIVCGVHGTIEERVDTVRWLHQLRGRCERPRCLAPGSTVRGGLYKGTSRNNCNCNCRLPMSTSRMAGERFHCRPLDFHDLQQIMKERTRCENRFSSHDCGTERSSGIEPRPESESESL